MFTLDIGGEGRHAEAWNLNPSPIKTLGSKKGTPIPRRIAGRAESIPLPNQYVDRIIVERTPLRRDALMEILRIIALQGEIILRHVSCPGFDPHALAKQVLCGKVKVRRVRIGGRWLQETKFCLSERADMESA